MSPCRPAGLTTVTGRAGRWETRPSRMTRHRPGALDWKRPQITLHRVLTGVVITVRLLWMVMILLLLLLRTIVGWRVGRTAGRVLRTGSRMKRQLMMRTSVLRSNKLMLMSLRRAPEQYR